MKRIGWGATLLCLFLLSCSPGAPDAAPASPTPSVASSGVDALTPDVVALLDSATDAAKLIDVDGLDTGGRFQIARVVTELANVGDARLGWVLVDLLRFEHFGELDGPLNAALARLTGVSAEGPKAWVAHSNALLKGNVAPPPDYLRWKRRLFTTFEKGWEPFLVAESDLDWRLVTWGGVGRDGITALRFPEVLRGDAAAAAWPDETVIFGLDLSGEQRAYPQPVLERSEMVNDSLGGIPFALSYCSLCGAPIPYRTAAIPGAPPVLDLRTSGLLQQSNKLMYDLTTETLFDQFTGAAVSGPLRGTKLATLDGLTTTWGQWRQAHPSTTVVSPATGNYTKPSLETTRDAKGPIFPVGAVDERLGAQTRVLGVRTDAGPVAFRLDVARSTLANGGQVVAEGARLVLRADGGVVAVAEASGVALSATESYWFAWSQFEPTTTLWQGN